MTYSKYSFGTDSAVTIRDNDVTIRTETENNICCETCDCNLGIALKDDRDSA